tara:strand:+ start:4694 stop:5122 length:429 start_codon:yes stop_codon:yes gene_type:complete
VDLVPYNFGIGNFDDEYIIDRYTHCPINKIIRNYLMAEEESKTYHPADTNGDGKVTDAEEQMFLEFKRKELEDADAMRDAQRSMAWFALFGMLLYPFAVVLATFVGLDQASKILGDMAATYFVSVAAIVAAFFGGQAFASKK